MESSVIWNCAHQASEPGKNCDSVGWRLAGKVSGHESQKANGTTHIAKESPEDCLRAHPSCLRRFEGSLRYDDILRIANLLKYYLVVGLRSSLLEVHMLFACPRRFSYSYLV